MGQINSTNTNYTRSGNRTMNTSTARPGDLPYKPSKQEMSTYKSTETDNLTKQGVGVTSVGVKARSVKYKGAGNPNRSYSVNIVNKAVAKMGGH